MVAVHHQNVPKAVEAPAKGGFLGEAPGLRAYRGIGDAH